MVLAIVPYEEKNVEEVKQFNSRLRSAGVEMQFPQSPIPVWLPHKEGSRIFQEHYLATEGSKVRGGYILKHQDFLLNGRVVSIGNFQLPLSEGIIDKQYAGVGLHLLTNALRRQPLLYALGVGCRDEPLAKLLQAAGWSISAVPFFFKVIKPFRFFCHMRYLRSSVLGQIVADSIAFSGAGWLGVRAIQSMGRKPAFIPDGYTTKIFDNFDSWTDQVWSEGSEGCVFSALRDRATLETLYPASSARFIKGFVAERKNIGGWCVLLATETSNHKYFGSLKVGSVVDCFAKSSLEQHVVAFGEDILRDLNVDLIVSNQSHAAWCKALSSNGFVRGPSNFLFCASRELTRRTAPLIDNFPCFHINRGDGDGPINL